MKNQIQIVEVESNTYLLGKILSQIGFFATLIFIFTAATGHFNINLLIISGSISACGLLIRFIAKKYILKTTLKTNLNV